jgi:hypothetical protein
VPPETGKSIRVFGGTSSGIAKAAKALTDSTLRCIGATPHNRPASLSKRAPSATRPSLRLSRINNLRRQRQPETANCVTNCVRPLNVPKSLTGFRRPPTGRQRPPQTRPGPLTSIAGDGRPAHSRADDAESISPEAPWTKRWASQCSPTCALYQSRLDLANAAVNRSTVGESNAIAQRGPLSPRPYSSGSWVVRDHRNASVRT